ncbi:hypothetical protein [Thalassospira povalilytica]|uniref:hypothetical protein n=1 Tax=Thalassospira povalilytica TaxID=732237 RepID=UPI001D1941A7|nr:hypothetical protein [Thalassospira povalilytica]MCC4240342.1 hypothetical protein [Thalassospira povalilytica]
MSEVNQDMLNALRNGEQMDFDGIMVKVSRQACEEGADLIELQDAELRAYKAHNALLQSSNDAMAEQHEKDQSLITELVGALEEMMSGRMNGPDSVVIWAQACATLSKAKDQTNDR